MEKPLSPIMAGLTNDQLMEIADNDLTFNQFVTSKTVAGSGSSGEHSGGDAASPGTPVLRAMSAEGQQERTLRLYMQGACRDQRERELYRRRVQLEKKQKEREEQKRLDTVDKLRRLVESQEECINWPDEKTRQEPAIVLQKRDETTPKKRHPKRTCHKKTYTSSHEMERPETAEEFMERMNSVSFVRISPARSLWYKIKTCVRWISRLFCCCGGATP